MSVSPFRAVCRILLGFILITSTCHFLDRLLGIKYAGYIDTPTFLLQTSHFLQFGEVYKNPLKSSGELEEFEPASPWFKFPPIYLIDYIPWVIAYSPNHTPSYDVQIESITGWLFYLHTLRYIASAIIILLILNKKRSTELFLLGGIITTTFYPFFDSLYGLIFDNLLLFICSLILWLSRIGKNRTAAGLIALAAMMKIYPAVLALPAIAHRNYHWLATIAVTSLCILIVSISVFGLHENLFYYFRLLPILLGEASKDSSGNLSLGSFFVTLAPSVETGMNFFHAFQWIMIAATFSVFYRNPSASLMDENRLSCVMCLMLVNLPNYWSNYQLIMLLPVLVLVARGFHGASGGRIQAVIAMACWLTMSCATTSNGYYLPTIFRDHFEIVTRLATLQPFTPITLWVCCCSAILLDNRATNTTLENVIKPQRKHLENFTV